jgi:hypothetical protein
VGWVDLLLVVLVVFAVINGLRLGAAVQVLSFVGFWLGLAVGVGIALVAARPLAAGPGRIILTLLLVLGCASAASAAGGVLGNWGAVALKRWHLGAVDSTVGAAIGVVAVLLSAWLVAGFIVQAQAGWLSESVARSAVLRSVDSIMPPVPSALARVQSLLSQEGFPTVFAVTAPPVASPILPPTPAASAAIAAPAKASVVKVLGQGCGGYVEGSGFVAGPGLVVTNAHVVAGVRSPQIIIGVAGYAATPVLVDPSLDVAVLRTSAPLGPALPLDGTLAPRGTPAAVIGYPENGPQRTTQAAVAASFDAQGRDIYGGGLVTRQVYELTANILPGDSGAPVVISGGQVVGLVFSRSTVDSAVGYALTAGAISSSVARAALSTTPVPTGACAAG